MADLPSLLPPNSAAFERASEQVSGARWAGLDVDIVRRSKDPWTAPEPLLGFLAYERSVDVWDDRWPSWKKRSVIAAAARDHRLKGTEAGLRRYLDIAGAELKQLVTPPQGFFASPDLGKVEWDALIARHPKVRITFARGRGQYSAPDGAFADHGFVDQACVTLDQGRALVGRRAVLVRDGVEQPLQLVSIERSAESRQGILLERVIVPGKSADSVVAGGCFADHAFADAWDQAPAYYSFSLSRSYVHEESRLSITTVPLGFSPREMRFHRESAAGQRESAFFVGDHAGDHFVTPDRGGELLADVLHLHDPAIAAPQVSGMSFVGHSRVGMPHHTAEALVDWKDRMIPGSAFVADTSFAGRDPAAPVDRARRDFVLDAVARSARATDRIRVTFQTHRDRRLGDAPRLDGSARLGASVPNQL